MSDLVWLTIIVLFATAMWPLNRWAMRSGARPEMIGICVSAVATALASLIAWASGQVLLSPAGLLLGGVAGVAYAVGFIMIIFYCLKIGPAGPTVTVNNLGLLGPVVVSLLCFSGSGQSSLIVFIGGGVTILALGLVAWNRSNDQGTTPITARWARWVLVGWAFSVVSMTMQFLSSQYAPAAPYAYVTGSYAVAFIVLGVVALVKRNGALRPEEWLAGIGTGIMVGIFLPVTLLLLTRMAAAIVFPVTVAGPVVLMLLIGHFLLHERLNPAGWAASLLGLCGLILLSMAGTG